MANAVNPVFSPKKLGTSDKVLTLSSRQQEDQFKLISHCKESSLVCLKIALPSCEINSSPCFRTQLTTPDLLGNSQSPCLIPPSPPRHCPPHPGSPRLLSGAPTAQQCPPGQMQSKGKGSHHVEQGKPDREGQELCHRTHTTQNRNQMKDQLRDTAGQ